MQNDVLSFSDSINKQHCLPQLSTVESLSNQVLFKTNNILLPVQWNGFNDLLNNKVLCITHNFLCLSKPVIATHFASFKTLTCTCSCIDVTVYASDSQFYIKASKSLKLNSIKYVERAKPWLLASLNGACKGKEYKQLSLTLKFCHHSFLCNLLDPALKCDALISRSSNTINTIITN